MCACVCGCGCICMCSLFVSVKNHCGRLLHLSVSDHVNDHNFHREHDPLCIHGALQWKRSRGHLHVSESDHNVHRVHE